MQAFLIFLKDKKMSIPTNARDYTRITRSAAAQRREGERFDARTKLILS